MDFIGEIIDGARTIYLRHVDTIEAALRSEHEAARLRDGLRDGTARMSDVRAAESAARHGRRTAEWLRRQFWREAAAIDEEIGDELDWAELTLDWEREHKG